MTKTSYDCNLTEAEREVAVDRVRQIAATIRNHADEVDRYADRLAETGDPYSLSYAANAITNMMANVRLDLLVQYAGEAYLRRLVDQHEESEADND